MTDENELQKENNKTSTRKKLSAVVIENSIIFIILTVSAAGYYAYQNGIFGNLFKENSAKQISTEGETSKSTENIVQESLADDTILEPKK